MSRKMSPYDNKVHILYFSKYKTKGKGKQEKEKDNMIPKHKENTKK